ncbi:MAG: trehalose-phosphatase [Deltaproteobacteria bacterium]|nr:trehalose-phosphatase [Deltaproteobacteria bacterium]
MKNGAEHWYRLARNPALALLLDYDGTLVPTANTPEEARPSPEVLALLTELANAPGVTCAIVSGRQREALDEMLGSVAGLRLVAEHGLWRRGATSWFSTASVDMGALDELQTLLIPVVDAHPGSRIERKTGAICVHYRGVRRSRKEAFVVRVTALLEEWLRTHPEYELLDVIEAVETRPRGVNKGGAVAWIRERAEPDVRCIMVGNDVTDEDMFAAVGTGDDGILVGPGYRRQTAARWHLEDPAALHTFLRWILAVRIDETVQDESGLPSPMALASLPRQPCIEPAPEGRGPSLLAISNRLPHLRDPSCPAPNRKQNVGGLVSALAPVIAERDGLWLGWSGNTIPGDQASAVSRDREASPPLAWIDLPAVWHEQYYNGFCNRALWPLFHSFPGRIRFSDSEWNAYAMANEAFAEAACSLVRPDAAIWVHDYHVLLVASALRRRGHTGPIGLFLHIPFPGADLFEMIPWADGLLDALLEFDLLGFHTPGYVANFRSCVARMTPAQVSDDGVEHRGRTVRVAAFPLGIIPESFQEPADPSTAEEIAALFQSIGSTQLVLGVDRLDYTKGIPERLLAFERMLQLFPSWKGRVSFVQVSVPSREDVPEYAEQRQLIETAVGRINGEHGEAHWVPVRYLYRSYGRSHLAQLYRAARVGYITPLRDGMNLVAKEFVAAQAPEDPGVLLLSRFAGAAVELREALLTNPYHTEGMARDLDRALRMEAPERKARHAALLATVSRTTALTWAADFVAALEAVRSAA